MNLYVYYDVSSDDARTLASDVRAMQATLATTTGVTGRLMKRPVANAGRETWMEIYEHVDDAFEGRLDRASARVEWRGTGPRHVERFVDV